MALRDRLAHVAPTPDPQKKEPSKRGRTARVSRERILDAALKEFAENGFEGATTASVARRVGVTQPLIHYHFGSKLALWRAAVELAFNRMGSLLQGIEEDMQRVDPSLALRTLVRRFVYFNAKHPEIGRLIVSESSSDTPRLEWMTEQHIRPMFAHVSMLLQAGGETGTLKKLPAESVLFAFLGAVPHYFDAAPLIRKLYGFNPLDPQRVDAHAETVVEIFAAGLLSDDE